MRLDLLQPRVERHAPAATAAGAAAIGAADSALPAWNSSVGGMQPTRTVEQVQVCAMRSQAFSSSRTLPGQW